MASGKEDQIQNAIQNQLVDCRVSVMESDNSIVLSGVVPSQDAKTQAGQIAQQYASGKRVDNELAVGSVSATNPSGQGNAAMRRQIEDALRSEATLSPTVAQNIAVNTINHNVVLSGTVPTQADKDKAQQVAQQSAGVMQVVNNIQVTSPLSNASSTETTVGVAGSASSVALSNSSTDTGASGNIGATGQSSTDSAGQSTTAEQDVPTGGATAAQSATDLKSQIENSLQKEQLTGVLVNVTDNTIELSGMVPNAKEKQTARRIAQSFAGTRKLVDHIRLTGEGQGPNAGSDTRSQRINQNPPGVRSTGDPNAPTTNPVPPHSSERGNASRGDLAGHPSSFVVPEKSALRGSRQQLFRSHAI
jgi:osmotically-inducible protein OsmY